MAFQCKTLNIEPVNDPGNTFALNPKWTRTLPLEILYLYIVLISAGGKNGEMQWKSLNHTSLSMMSYILTDDWSTECGVASGEYYYSFVIFSWNIEISQWVMTKSCIHSSSEIQTGISSIIDLRSDRKRTSPSDKWYIWPAMTFPRYLHKPESLMAGHIW